jgi:hypothetical protein
LNRALRVRLEAIEKRVKPHEPWFVFLWFDDSDEEFDIRLGKFRLERGLTPNSTLHIVRVRFNDPEGWGK